LNETGECDDFFLFTAGTRSAGDDCVSRIERLGEHREERSSSAATITAIATAAAITAVVGITPSTGNIAISFTIIRGLRL
jgi:hypothetical protein